MWSVMVFRLTSTTPPSTRSTRTIRRGGRRSSRIRSRRQMTIHARAKRTPRRIRANAGVVSNHETRLFNPCPMAPRMGIGATHSAIPRGSAISNPRTTRIRFSTFIIPPPLSPREEGAEKVSFEGIFFAPSPLPPLPPPFHGGGGWNKNIVLWWRRSRHHKTIFLLSLSSHRRACPTFSAASENAERTQRFIRVHPRSFPHSLLPTPYSLLPTPYSSLRSPRPLR
jgi:hypothetical protein